MKVLSVPAVRPIMHLAAGVLSVVLPQRSRPGRRRVEEELRKLRADLEQHVQDRTRQLEEANRELEAFSYSVSHDLRAPLRAIDGFSNALLEDYGDRLEAEGIEHLHKLCAAARKMSRLIDDLLLLSRAARGPMERTLFNVSEMVETVALELTKNQPERHVEFVIAPQCLVWADRNLVRIVLENLLGNAWKFTGRTSTATIEFGFEGPDSDRVLFVRDNGAGFDMEYAHNLFSPFQRLHATDEYPGTGIGLATVQRIVRRHGGQVWIEGAVGRGATVRFTFGRPDQYA